MSELLLQLIIAGAGTVAFALLYSVPGRFLLPCGLAGGLGWLVYILLDETTWVRQNCRRVSCVFSGGVSLTRDVGAAEVPCYRVYYHRVFPWFPAWAFTGRLTT